MVPGCKHSIKIDEACYKCKLDNSLHWGIFPCYCLFYKPFLFQNIKFKTKLLIDDICDVINSIVKLEE